MELAQMGPVDKNPFAKMIKPAVMQRLHDLAGAAASLQKEFEELDEWLQDYHDPSSLQPSRGGGWEEYVPPFYGELAVNKEEYEKRRQKDREEAERKMARFEELKEQVLLAMSTDFAALCVFNGLTPDDFDDPRLKGVAHKVFLFMQNALARGGFSLV
jgi:hypothetical protein